MVKDFWDKLQSARLTYSGLDLKLHHIRCNGEHGVYASTDSGIAARSVTAAEGLIRFVNEDVTAAERVNHAKDFLEGPFA